MFTRIASLCLAMAALAIGAAYAADKEKPTPDSTLDGSIFDIMDRKVSVLDMQGKTITTFKIGKDAEFGCNGQKCSLQDLAKGVLVTVTYKTDADNVLWATKIAADTKKKGK